MKARVVIGANFGDEGKGLTTDWLCRQGAGMVVRFNGGANVGHTVVTPEGKRHVFRHFGAGTFCGVPTFLSQFVVVNPLLWYQERCELESLGESPVLYAHPDCIVTTFVDMMINQIRERDRGGKRHGSCGIGLHETMVRSEELAPHLKVTMGDLWNGAPRLEEQLAEMCGKWSRFRVGREMDLRADINQKATEAFRKACNLLAENTAPMGIGDCRDPVFEGAQGLLLSQDNREYAPHLTHSYTGMRNVRLLCDQAGIEEREVYYVSRTYLTRHGAGPLPGEDSGLDYEETTNIENEFQGRMRFAPLKADALKARCAADAVKDPWKLVMTHCDQEDPPCPADWYSEGPSSDAMDTSHMPMAISV